MAKTLPPKDEALAEAALSLALRRQIRFWLIAVAVFALFLYMFSDILLPFLAGLALLISSIQ